MKKGVNKNEMEGNEGRRKTEEGGEERRKKEKEKGQIPIWM